MPSSSQIFPAWTRADGGERRSLGALLLLGGWQPDNPPDIQVISIFGLEIQSIQNLSERLHREAPGAFRWFRGRAAFRQFFAWAEHASAWDELAPLCIDEAHLENLLAATSAALLRNVNQSVSPAMRYGIIESLALLAHRSSGFKADRAPGLIVDEIVWQLLTPDRERWVVLNKGLPLLAEASPLTFLDAIERSLLLNDAGVSGIFSIGQEGSEVGVVWALQTLAWDVILMPRVAEVLASIIEKTDIAAARKRLLDQLEAIIGFALPQTNASTYERIASLRRIAASHPKIRWDLLMHLLPMPIGLRSPARRPQILPISTPEDGLQVSGREQHEHIRVVLELAKEHAGTDPTLWTELLKDRAHIPDDLASDLLDGLTALKDHIVDPDARIWSALRGLLHWMRGATEEARQRTWHRRRFQKTECLYQDFRPIDLIPRYTWLFARGHHPAERFSGIQEEWAFLEEQRRLAVEDVLSQPNGWEALARLGEQVEEPDWLALAITRSTYAVLFEQRLLASETFAPYSRIAPLFLAVRFSSLGREFGAVASLLRRLMQANHDQDALALVESIPRLRIRSMELWTLLDKEDLLQSLRTRYWQDVKDDFLAYRNSPEAQKVAVMRLLEHGRAERAVHIAAMADPPLPAPLILEVLEHLPLPPQQEVFHAPKWQEVDIHHIGHLLDVLAKTPLSPSEIEHARLIELRFLDVLDWYDVPPHLLGQYFFEQPDGVARALAERPEAIYRLSKVVKGYPGANLPIVQMERELAQWGQRLLASMSDEHGQPAWPAIEAVATILERPAQGEDGIWPCKAARLLLERYREDLRRALKQARRQGRGMTSRSIGEGGDQERELVRSYRQGAEYLRRNYWLETASLLDELADEYETWASIQDDEAAFDRWRYNMEPTHKPVPPLFPIACLTLRDFRSASRLDVPLSERLTVLYGKNASGKTTILQAIAIGLSEILGGLPGLEKTGHPFLRRDVRKNFGPSDTEGVPVTSARIEIQSAIQSNDSNELLRWASERRYSGTVPQHGTQANTSIDIAALHQYLAPIKEALRTGDQSQVSLPVFAYYGVERAVAEDLRTATGNERPADEEQDDELAKRLGGLISAVKTTTRFAGAVRWLVAMQAQEDRLARERGDLGFELPALQAVRRAIKNAVWAAVSDTSTARRSRCEKPRISGERGRLVVDFYPGHAPDGPAQELELGQLSDGFRTHLALVMDLARRMVQCNPPPEDGSERDGWGTRSHAVVLIDEVDLHLHPLWQQTVLPSLLETFPRAQFIVTTHSPHVLASVDQSSHTVLLLQTDKNGLRCVNPPMQVFGAKVEDILKLDMGVDPRPPAINNEYRRKLDEYLELVEQGKGQTPGSLSLRDWLNNFRADDPDLLGADLDMRRQKAFGIKPRVS